MGDQGSTPGLGRSAGEGNGGPLQYSCLGNPKDRGAWQATVHGVTKSWTWLREQTTSKQLYVTHHTIVVIQTFKTFLVCSSVYSIHFLISSASLRSLRFLSFIVPILVLINFLSLIFLNRSLVFLILLFSSISLHCLFRKTFLSLYPYYSLQLCI